MENDIPMKNNIYILTPGNVVTGGVELLHQLSYKLNLLGFSSCIVYCNRQGEPAIYNTPEIYEKYNSVVSEAVEDNENSIVVFPEVFLYKLSEIKKAKRVLWWLSVDNAAGYEDDFTYAFADKSILHFSQSEYSTQYLIKNGVEKNRIYWLSDYINSEFLHIDKTIIDKDNIVVFNPRKGIEKTLELIRNSYGNIKWVALSGFTPVGMRDILQKAKVYIDFGNHPGRDRIPREATYCGCCLITNQEGSANNNIDIPIDEKYKISSETDTMDVLRLIHSILDNYQIEVNNISEYRKRTAEEFMRFEIDVLNVFGEVLGCKISDNTTEEIQKNRIISCFTAGDLSGAYYEMIKYRYLGFEEDSLYNKIEANIRIEIGEYNEAEYVISKELEKDINNPEIYLILAKIHLNMRTAESVKECISDCLKVMELASGTQNENTYYDIANQYVIMAKQMLKI